MADWSASTRWQESCRIRVPAHVVPNLDGVESNHGRAAPGFRSFRRCARTTPDYRSGES